MTVQSSTICNIIQAFPVLLILAQNTNKCLHTPFVYKPPSPTHSPEYYEAYETLLHALLNDHGCNGYQYGIPYAYGKKYPQFKNLCYNFNQPSIYNRYPPIHGYTSHGHMTYGYPDSNGDNYYQSLGNRGYTYYGSRSANGLNTTKYVYKSNYAPNQSHVRRKYKVVAVDRTKGRSQKLQEETCTTIDNTDGSCINIKFCEPYVKLLEQAKTNSRAVQVLRKAHCGFDGSTPKVCCPRPGIPDEPPPEVPTQPPNPVTPAPTDIASGKSLGADFITAFPSPPECGLSNASFGRVVGGIDAQLGDFPWMALLGYKGKRNPTTSWLCGGSLITHHHVLTAAHCIHNHEVDLYVVRVGELDLAREDEGATPVDVLIKEKIKHEGYNPKAFTNDIGLLVLQNDVQFTDLIRPICIPMDAKLRSTNFEDYMPFIAGWGDLEFRGPKATRLQVLQLPVVSNDFCRQAYAAYKAQVIDERVLCAGFKKGGKDSCQGDSGGPLMQPIYNFENATTYIYQIGVVSFGKKCAEPGFPGVYSRVTNFVPWLEEKVLGIASTN